VRHNPHGSFQSDPFAHIKLDNGMTVAKLGCESKPASKSERAEQQTAYRICISKPGRASRVGVNCSIRHKCLAGTSNLPCGGQTARTTPEPARSAAVHGSPLELSSDNATVGQRISLYGPVAKHFMMASNPKLPMQANLIFKLHGEMRAEHDTGD
jgi:hypothetical protein